MTDLGFVFYPATRETVRLERKQAVSFSYDALSQTLVGEILIVSSKKKEFGDDYP